MATGTELLIYDLALSLMLITLLMVHAFQLTTNLTIEKAEQFNA
jgi:hypothetical protein